MLTEESQQEQQRYFDEYAEAHLDRKRRWEAKTAKNPMRQDLTNDWQRGESQRERWLPAVKSKSQGELNFRRSIMSTFHERIQVQDEMENLRKEKRALLDKEKQQRAQMEVERTRMKMVRAAQLRPAPKDDLKLLRELKDEERYQKQEFMRSLAGWDGRRLKARSKSVAELWQVHRDSRLRAANSYATTWTTTRGSDATFRSGQSSLGSGGSRRGEAEVCTDFLPQNTIDRMSSSPLSTPASRR